MQLELDFVKTFVEVMIAKDIVDACKKSYKADFGPCFGTWSRAWHTVRQDDYKIAVCTSSSQGGIGKTKDLLSL